MRATLLPFVFFFLLSLPAAKATECDRGILKKVFSYGHSVAMDTKLGWKKYWGEVRDTKPRGLRFFIKPRDASRGRSFKNNKLGYFLNPIETALNLKYQMTIPLSLFIYTASPIALDPLSFINRTTDKKNAENLKKLYEDKLAVKDRVMGGDYLFHLLQDGAIDEEEFSVKLAQQDFFLAKWVKDSTLTPPAIQEMLRLGYLNEKQAKDVNLLARRLLVESLRKEKLSNPAGSKTRPGWFNELPVDLYRALEQDPQLSKLHPNTRELLLMSYFPVPEIEGSTPIELSSVLMQGGGKEADPLQRLACENIVKLLVSPHPLSQGDALLLAKRTMEEGDELQEKSDEMKKLLGEHRQKLLLRPDLVWLEKTSYDSETELWKQIFENPEYQDLRSSFERGELGESQAIEKLVARLEKSSD